MDRCCNNGWTNEEILTTKNSFCHFDKTARDFCFNSSPSIWGGALS